MGGDEQAAEGLAHRVAGGDGEAAEELWASLYGELRAAAGRLLGRERENRTLQPTALVNEAWLRLGVELAELPPSGRSQLMAFAGAAMRRVLVDHHRRREAGKRGGGLRPLSIASVECAEPAAEYDLLELDDALEQLKRVDERTARCMELRLFAGLSNQDLAEETGLSLRSVQECVRRGTTFLHGRLSRS